MNKKSYDDLFVSIYTTVLLLISICFFVFMLLFGVIYHNEGTDPVLALFMDILLFGSSSIMLLVFIIKYCYWYWIITENEIIFKKILRKKTVIKWDEITKIELGTIKAYKADYDYSAEAYIISSEDKVINIQITKRNKRYLSQLFQKHEKCINNKQQV